MMKYKLTLLVLLFFTNCEPNWDFQTLEESPKLVVYGYIQPLEVVSLTVSRTVASLDNVTDRIITDAEVVLFENDIAIDTLVHTTDGIYTSLNNFKSEVGKWYFIQVSKIGFPTLKSTPDIVPDAPIIQGYEAIDSIGKTDLFSETVISQISIDFETVNNPTDFIGYRATIPNIGGANDGFFSTLDREDCRWSRWNTGVFYYLKSFCLPVANKLVLQSDDYLKSELQMAKVKLCQSSANAVIYHQKLGDLLGNSNIGSSTNLFYEPSLLPQMVENGYGYFGTCNCIEIEVNF